MASSQNYYLRTFHGLILVGLGVLAITHYWWPGILFVFSIAMLCDALIQRKAWRAFATPVIIGLIGLLFHYDRQLGHQAVGIGPIILIVLGLLIIFSRR